MLCLSLIFIYAEGKQDDELGWKIPFPHTLQLTRVTSCLDAWDSPEKQEVGIWSPSS